MKARDLLENDQTVTLWKWVGTRAVAAAKVQLSLRRSGKSLVIYVKSPQFIGGAVCAAIFNNPSGNSYFTHDEPTHFGAVFARNTDLLVFMSEQGINSPNDLAKLGESLVEDEHDRVPIWANQRNQGMVKVGEVRLGLDLREANPETYAGPNIGGPVVYIREPADNYYGEVDVEHIFTKTGGYVWFEPDEGPFVAVSYKDILGFLSSEGYNSIEDFNLDEPDDSWPEDDGIEDFNLDHEEGPEE